ncbi:hypothetical protein N7448_007541 [Penicillium atrosanguineum]|nr:hypothetical protein N7448_007541 [Penicillium atrosanguineum]
MESTTLSTVKNVDTELVFWHRPEDMSVVSDFTKDKPEECMPAMKALDEKHPVQVQDIRGQEGRFTLGQNGFQYVHHDILGFDKASDSTHVESVIIPEMEKLVQQITDATRTITFTHRVRCFADDSAMLANNRAPAHIVHSDFTAAGALCHLRSVVQDAEERQRLLEGRVQIINVWRPLKTIERDPLATGDKTALQNRLVLPTGWNELGKYAFNPRQKWYYVGGQRPQEAPIFRQFDSQEDQGGMTLPHTAFVDPSSTSGPARESIEIKMFAFM